MRIILPDDVRYIIGKLTENGYEAYAVGGCVRDSILRRVPGDWDVTTSAKPDQVKNIFRRTIDTGIQHGTVTVMLNHKGYEVTTYRVDGEYEDSRHPKNVEFTSSLFEDLRRRDFTINAMAYNEDNGIVDEFEGMRDIEKGIIRCVGDPKERFSEDALRMLRAVRFSAQLGFSIDDNTSEAIKKLAPSISKISQERIHAELGKTLLSANPDFIDKASELEIMPVILPEYGKADRSVVRKLLKAVPCEISFRYAAMLYALDEKETVRALRRLKLDNETVRRTSCIISNHGMVPAVDEREVRKAAAHIGKNELRNVLTFEKAFYDVTGNEEKSGLIGKEADMLDDIEKRGDCVSIAELAINGKDLIRMGVSPGKKIGEILMNCLDIVIDDPDKNKYDILYDIVRSRMSL